MRLRLLPRSGRFWAVVAGVTVVLAAAAVVLVPRWQDEQDRRLPRVRTVTGCPAPSGGPPPVATASGPGPLVPAQSPESVQLCEGSTQGDGGPFYAPVRTGLDEVVTAINSLRPAAPGETCVTGDNREIWDVVLRYADATVVVSVDMKGCGVTYRDGQFRHGGNAVVDLVIRKVLERR